MTLVRRLSRIVAALVLAGGIAQAMPASAASSRIKDLASIEGIRQNQLCLLYTSPSPRDRG